MQVCAFLLIATFLAQVEAAFNPTSSQSLSFTIPEGIDVSSDFTTVFRSTDDGTGCVDPRTLSGADAAQFTITANTFSAPLCKAVLRFANPVDYETKNSYDVTVTFAESATPATTAETVISITVLNLNDETPVIPANTPVSITEDNLDGDSSQASLVNITFTDADEQDKSQFFARLLNDFGGKFSVGGIVNVSAGNYIIPIYRQSVFDYEEAPSYTLTVEVSDSIHVTTGIVTVTITNVDEPATFDNLNATIFALEDSADLQASLEVYKVRYSNSDTATITPSIDSVTGSGGADGSSLFTISNHVAGESFGVLRVASTILDYEVLDPASPEFLIVILLTNDADNSLVSTATLTYIVNNTNESPYFVTPSDNQVYAFVEGNYVTAFGTNFLAATTSTTERISPSSASNLPDLRVRDPDCPNGGFPGYTETITYSIMSSAVSKYFRMDCDNSGGKTENLQTASTSKTVADCSLEWAQAVDYETLEERPDFNIVIIATDSQSRTARLSLKIRIYNDNDESISFPDAPFSATISENSPLGTLIGTVSGIDTDTDGSNSCNDLRYTLTNNNAGPIDALSAPGNYWFSLQERTQFGKCVADVYQYYPFSRDVYNTGTLSVRVYLRDSEPSSPYAYGETSSSSTILTLTITDVNNNRPVITSLYYNTEIYTTAPVDTDVDVTVSANEVIDDTGANGRFLFYLLANSLYFNINENTGTVYKKVSTVLIAERRYDVIVSARDQGTNPVLRSPPVVVRIDAYYAPDYQVSLTLDMPESSFTNAVKANLLTALNSEFSPWYFRFSHISPSSSASRTVIQIYALTSSETESYDYYNITKTFVHKSELLTALRADPSGTPVTVLTSGITFTPFNIISVEESFADPEDSRYWFNKPFGLAACIVGALVLAYGIGFIVYGIYQLATMKATPPPPKPRKVVRIPTPVPKPQPEKTGPGPQLVVDKVEDDLVSRPVQRSKDPVTGREFLVNPETGERTWADDGEGLIA